MGARRRLPKPKKSKWSFNKKKWLRVLRILFFVLAGCGLIAAFGYFSVYGPSFQVTEDSVVINGNERIATAEITQVVLGNIVHDQYSFLDGHIMTVDEEQIKSDIERRYPQIASVNVKRELPHDITVSIEEFEVITAVCRSAARQCVTLDADGIVQQEVGQQDPLLRENDVVYFEVEDALPVKGVRLFTREQLGYARYFVRELPFEVGMRPLRTEVMNLGESHFRVTTDGEWDIMIDSNHDPRFAMLVLKEFLSHQDIAPQKTELKEVDLRIKNRVFYK